MIDAAVAAAAVADPPAAAFTPDLLKRVHLVLLDSDRDAPAVVGKFRSEGASSWSTGFVYGPPDGLELAVGRFFAEFAQQQQKLATSKDPGAAFSLSLSTPSWGSS